jgi:N-acylneuraminate cytidylyltransferase
LLRIEGVAEPHSQPRQQLPEVFWQNGYVDVIRPRTILELGSMAGRRILPFVMDEPILELDYPEDVARIEAALSGKPARVSTARHPV